MNSMGRYNTPEKQTRQKINVLCITQEYGKRVAGGVGRVINGIAANIDSEIVLDFFYLKFNILRMNWDARIYRNGENREVAGNIDFINTLVKLLKKKSYQIVHLMHSGLPVIRCLGILREQFPELKIIYSCHSISKYEIGIRPHRMKDIKHEEYLLGNIDHIQFLNHASIHYFHTVYPDLHSKISCSIIPNGINEEDYRKIDYRWKRKIARKADKEKNYIVLCISRWSQGKGLEYLLGAIPYVISQVRNVKFIIAGKKIISWEKDYIRYVHMINCKIRHYSKHIIPLGWLNDIQRNTLFALADVCVMPSLLEYMPYSLLEPAVAQIPLVSAGIDCARELMEENHEGLFYDPEDTEELAEKILMVIKREKFGNQLALRAYRKIIRQYNWKKISEMYKQMYENVLM